MLQLNYYYKIILSCRTLIIKKRLQQKKADIIREYDCIDSTKKEKSEYDKEIAVESDFNVTICDAYGQLPT